MNVKSKKPYVIYLAEVIYKDIVNIKKSNPNISNDANDSNESNV